MDTAAVLARLGRSGALPGWLRPALVRTRGFDQVVTGRAAIEALLAHPSVTVPYGPRSDDLGLGAFPLALDGPEHLAARSQIAAAVAATSEARAIGVEAARAEAQRRVAAAGPRLEVATGVVDAALGAWIEGWYGLPGQGHALIRTGRAIMHATFLNRGVTDDPSDPRGLEWATTHIDEHRRHLVDAVADAPTGTVAAVLLAATGDAEVTARHVLGLTVGPLALGPWTLCQVIDRALDRPWTLDSLRSDADGRAAFVAAVPAVPPLPGVLRSVPAPVRVPSRRGGNLEVPAGRVLAATACPHLLGEDDGPDLTFGSGPHACLGVEPMAEVAGVVLVALGARAPRRLPGPRGRLRTGPRPSAVRSWDLPGQLEVALSS